MLQDFIFKTFPDEVKSIILSYLTIDDRLTSKLKPNKLKMNPMYIPMSIYEETKKEYETHMEIKYEKQYSLYHIEIIRKQYRKRKSKKWNGKIGFEHYIKLKNPLKNYYYSVFFGYYIDTVHIFRVNDWNNKVVPYI